MSCPYEACGGCQYWPLSYEHELEKKRAALAQTLGVEESIIEVNPSPSEHAYRSRLMLRIHCQDQAIGFFAHQSRRLVDVSHCMVATPTLNAVIKEIRGILATGLFGENYRLHLQQVRHDDALAVIAHLVAAEESSQEILKFQAELLEKTSLVHITVGNQRGLRRFEWDRQDGVTWTIGTREFAQANLTVNHIMRSRIAEWCQGARTVLDAYGGSGNLSLLLARHCKVHVWEVSTEAGVSFDANLECNDKDSLQANFVRGDLGKGSWPLTDTVLIDPPRSGASRALIRQLLDRPCPTLIYVSCWPISLARDLGMLTSVYKIEEIAMFDMLPRTKHVEVLCKLSPRFPQSKKR